MIFLTVRPMIFLILSLSKDAGNHPAQAFAAVSTRGEVSVCACGNAIAA
jgi:hypothetical protein